MTLHSRGAEWAVVALAASLPLPAMAQQAAAALPTFAELEAAGARIGEIHIRNRQIFDTDNPKEDRWLFRWANRLHIPTRASVIERSLLFKSGDRVSVAQIDETERLLRSNRFLYDVALRPIAVHDGIVDIEVETRDTWSLDPGFSAGRTGGENTSGIRLRDYNLLGTGINLSIGRSNGVDRSSNEFQFSNDNAFGTWTSISYSLAQSSDGRRDAVQVERPFYSLDAHWAAGVEAVRDNRLDALYQEGEVLSQYRHRLRMAEAYAGWSAGRVDGWARRYSVGLDFSEDHYAVEPGLAAPPALPVDEKLVSPFFRFEVVEDRFDKQLNRNLIGKPEFFALGLNAMLQLGWAAPELGSTQSALLFLGKASRGWEPAPQQTLITTAQVEGRVADGRVQRAQLGGSMQFYRPQGSHWLFYAAGAGDVLHDPAVGDTLLLGGDNGLRGFPLRYQGGTRRMLFTVEERGYSDLYVLQLFRVGGAAFVDVGRAWGGDNANRTAPGWLANAGLGLRIVSSRAAFGNVLHVDLAFPIDADAAIKRVQFLVKTKASF